MIWTRIGVLRITATEAQASWLSTGIRWARTAPTMRPIANEPAMPTAEAFIVFLKPSQSWSRLSQMKDHSNEARILMRQGYETRMAAPGGGHSLAWFRF